MEKWIDTIILKLQEIPNVRIVSGFPMTELIYPTIAITKVGGEIVKRTTLEEKIKGADIATIRNAQPYSVLFQIDVFAQSSRERDQLMMQAMNKLRELRIPTFDSPVMLVNAYGFRDEDTGEEYRGTFTARLYCLSYEESQEYLVKQINTNVAEVK